MRIKTLAIGTSIAALLTILPLQAAPAQVGTFDLDGDGSITRTEFVRGRGARFTAFDRNGDRMISAEDFPEGKQTTLLGHKLDQVIASADLNHDGKITQLELELTGSPLFERADRDGNGIVERDEIAQFKAQYDAPQGDPGTPQGDTDSTEDSIAGFKAQLPAYEGDSAPPQDYEGAAEPADAIAQFKAQLASPGRRSGEQWEYADEFEPME